MKQDIPISQKMKPVHSFFSLNLILIFHFFPFHNMIKANHINITETCKQFARQDPNINCNFCTTSLDSDPDSGSADLYRLGKISIKLLQTNVTSTRKYIKSLLKKKPIDSYTVSCLKDCLELYSDAISTIKEAMVDYKSKVYEDCNVKVSSVMDASATCEDGFNGKEGTVSPLTKWNDDTFGLSAVALSIAKMYP